MLCRRVADNKGNSEAIKFFTPYVHIRESPFIPPPFFFFGVILEYNYNSDF